MNPEPMNPTKDDMIHQALGAPLVLREMCCVYVPVRNRAKSLEFYQDKLGMTAKALPDGTCEVSTGRTALRLIECPRAKERITLAFWLPIWEFLQARDTLRAAGLHVEGPSDRHGVEQVLTFMDPDGHRVELVARGGSSDLMKSRLELLDGRGRGPGGQSWKIFYEAVPVEDMPWYTDCLDEDLIEALAEYAPLPGRLLELGAGPGTAAARLAALGYRVLAVDIAPAAVEQAHVRFGILNTRLTFQVADVCRSMSHMGSFDYAFDRGCFHSLSPEDRARCVHNIADVLRPGGRFFLKVFSRDEPGERGPYRFSQKELIEIFQGHFDVLFVTKTTFEGPAARSPKGLFLVMEMR